MTLDSRLPFPTSKLRVVLTNCFAHSFSLLLLFSQLSRSLTNIHPLTGNNAIKRSKLHQNHGLTKPKPLLTKLLQTNTASTCRSPTNWPYVPKLPYRHWTLVDCVVDVARVPFSSRRKHLLHRPSSMELAAFLSSIFFAATILFRTVKAP